MENLIALLGLLFLMLMILAASVEVVLDIFRGVLERLGVTWAKSKVSLDDALKLAGEFSPDNEKLNTRLQALKMVTKRMGTQAETKLEAIGRIEHQLTDAAPEAVARARAELNTVAAEIKGELEANERLRILVLRSIAAGLGCVLVYSADFYVFRMLAEAPEAKGYLAGLDGLKAEWVNVLVGGLAAAAGSSYWHDQLDKVRKLKALVGDTKKLTG